MSKRVNNPVILLDGKEYEMRVDDIMTVDERYDILKEIMDLQIQLKTDLDDNDDDVSEYFDICKKLFKLYNRYIDLLCGDNASSEIYDKLGRNFNNLLLFVGEMNDLIYDRKAILDEYTD